MTISRSAAPAGVDHHGAERNFIVWFDDVGLQDVARVGGKNASLGELRRNLHDAGVRVPDGFAVTAAAYWHLVDANALREPIADQLAALSRGERSLQEVGATIRALLLDAPLPSAVVAQIKAAYATMSDRAGHAALDVAVRSSATAEDLPEASFAGQQESFLAIVGADAVVDAVRRCFASLFTDRAIIYREKHGFDHTRVALSVGVQQMVRSDVGAAGVLFTLDPETGFPGSIVIDGSWGLGEAVVKGIVDPDEWIVFKPMVDVARTPVLSRRLGSKEQRIVYDSREATRIESVPAPDRDRFVLDEDQVLVLSRWAIAIEHRYGRPMDIEWALDGQTGELWIVQARPETVQSRASRPVGRTWRLLEPPGSELATGTAIGTAIATGTACVLTSPDHVAEFPPGGVLVALETDPDWVPAMRRAAAIVTEHGGRTSHAAIVSREMGVPAIVGAHDATAAIPAGTDVTVSCSEGDAGHVYRGAVEYESRDVDVDALPSTRTPVMLSLADPGAASSSWHLPARGCGLARMEFIIVSAIGVHPMAVAHPQLLEPAEHAEIALLATGHESVREFFVERLASGIARIAAARHPDPVIVRLSDFKTNEYRSLVGGVHFEPVEQNPMIGWRGASRYASAGYREGFALECAAISRVRERMGLANIALMVPFCRTVDEAEGVLAELARNGLERGADGLQVFLMAELPVNVLCAREFADRFDGFSIGSNDLTQLVLGVDRDSEQLARLYDERHPAVVRAIRMLIEEAHAVGKPVGFCGNAPSSDPTYARLLVELGIDSITVTPDAFADVVKAVAAAETAAHEP